MVNGDKWCFKCSPLVDAAGLDRVERRKFAAIPQSAIVA